MRIFEGPKVENKPQFAQSNTKKTLENCRLWWYTRILVKKKFTFIYDRLVTEMNRCLQEEMTKEEITQIQKDKKRNRSKQLQTHNVPTDDVENTNDTN